MYGTPLDRSDSSEDHSDVKPFVAPIAIDITPRTTTQPMAPTNEQRALRPRITQQDGKVAPTATNRSDSM